MFFWGFKASTRFNELVIVITSISVQYLTLKDYICKLNKSSMCANSLIKSWLTNTSLLLKTP